MSLRARVILYLVLTHVVFFSTTAFLLRSHPIWLLTTELFFVFSLWYGIHLTGAVFEPLRMIRSGIAFLKGRDFTTRFREAKHPEMNELIHVYNEMANHLREERVRGEEQEHFLQEVLSLSSTGVITLDVERRISSVNTAALRMLEVERSVLMGSQLEEVNTTFAQDLARLEPGEVRLLTRRGSQRVRCRMVGLLDQGFTRGSYLLEEFTEEYHHAERTAYGKLIRMMSHEVNNTTGAVNSLLESCLNYRDQICEEDRTDFINALEVAIGRNAQMSSFMRGFAEVVRLPPPQTEPTNLIAILDRVSMLYAGELQRRRIELRSEVGENSPNLLLDPVQMEQALLNIIKNSIEAIETDGKITIHLVPNRSEVKLIVEDNGPGLSPETAEQLFSSFFTTKENGQGIGLTLVREILLGHGCDFTLEGDGTQPTRFHISFPAQVIAT